MSKEAIMELHKSHRESHAKYTYFLLAVVASAIAFAIQKTTGSAYSWYQVPLGAALVLWALSFYFGCKKIEWTQISFTANQDFLHLAEKIHPNQPSTQEGTEDAIRAVRKSLADAIESARVAGKKQFWLLVWGVIAFISWHLLEMYQTTMGI